MNSRELYKLRLAISIVNNAKKMGWTTRMVRNRIHLRKKKVNMTVLDKDPEKLVEVLCDPI